MNKNTTVEQLSTLKLAGMAKRYQAALNLPSHQQEDAHSLIAMLCHAEIEYRNHQRTERLLKNSKLRYHALLEEIICKPERGLTREMLLRLSDGMFITKGDKCTYYRCDRHRQELSSLRPGAQRMPNGT